MSIALSLLAILDQEPTYGLALKNEFETRTGGVWPLNVGQVYTTLDRLERDGLVRVDEEVVDGQKVHEITDAGHAKLLDWFRAPVVTGAPTRDELVLKLVMAVRHPGVDAHSVIQGERRGAMQQLQEFTLLKKDPPTDADLGWTFLVESLIFQTEARVRWLDHCEAVLGRSALEPGTMPAATASIPAEEPSEVRR